ncbi:transcriptional regulator [Siminovitchia terrae]|uniref:Transcriptional regulator n=2 Tax=Siminovitchia terrae TaxID=1914933 RepID=A0ABQ4KQU6_SIMTE|nr:transcriptional regulator [Siminovitchia terrae]
MSNIFDTYFVFFYNRSVKKVLHLFRDEGVGHMQNRIKHYRENKGISQGKLADLCNVSRQTINAIENNKYDPSLKLAFELAKTLGVKVDKLFFNVGEMDK